MSTRCQIGFYEKKESKIKEFEALIYRHSDGYPGTADGAKYGVLADIVPFLKWFKENRGISDLEYASARLLQWLCNEYDKRSKKYSQKIESFVGTLGHGICKDFHGDIEYFYKIYPNSIEVIIPKPFFEWANYDNDKKPDYSQWKTVQTINI